MRKKRKKSKGTGRRVRGVGEEERFAIGYEKL
jgi:hypothetical protein